ncbi:MAG: hypothetical protein H7249_04895 [Chitinophagaceae bacterium]|nr:hypothetical protein [Oligoflexus sp.]
MIMNKTLVGTLLSFSAFFIAPHLRADQNCDPRDYASFVASAQSLDPSADAVGRKMLQCGNRDYRESSFYWLGFYYAMTNHKEKIKSLAELMPPETNTSPKSQVQRMALKGNTQPLADQVKAETPGYIDDPWILMSLARAQMSTDQYALAYKNFDQVLRLKEEQDAAEIELLYAYIWAHDDEAALGKLSALRRYDPSMYMRQSLDRAAIILGGDQAKGAGRRDWLSLGYYQQRDNRGYAEMGGKARYAGAVDLEVEALQHERPIEDTLENAVGIGVGKEWGDEHSLRLLTDIGWYSVGDTHVTGKLGAEKEITEGLEGKVEIQRKNVSALERPPGGERAGLMRDTAKWGLDWHERAIVSAALHREDSKAVFEDYRGELKLGALLKEDTVSGFGFIIPVSYRHRPLASPDYRSYPHDFRIGLGLRTLLTDGRKYLMRAEAVVESINRDDYGAVGSYQKLLGGHGLIHLRYYFLKDYYNFFEGSAFTIERMLGEKEDDRGSEFLVGIGVSQVTH